MTMAMMMIRKSIQIPPMAAPNIAIINVVSISLDPLWSPQIGDTLPPFAKKSASIPLYMHEG